MPSYRDLLAMIRQGKSTEEIRLALPMRPSHWRRMLNGKRFVSELRTYEDLAVVLGIHKIASGVHLAAERLAELLESENSETARKVSLALLSEGFENASRGEDESVRKVLAELVRPAPWRGKAEENSPPAAPIQE